MANGQRTSDKPVSEGLARQLGRMVEDAARNYPGGTAKAELAKGHPDFVRQFYKFLNHLVKEREINLPIAEWPSDKTIRLGIHRNVNGLRNALKEIGCKISHYADGILDQLTFTVSPIETEVDLMIVTLANLGFSKGAICKDIYDKAIMLGLSLCPPEVGPESLLQIQGGLQKGNRFIIGMEPIVSDGNLVVFNVENHYSGLQWLGASSGNPSRFWKDNPRTRWVFARIRSKSG